VFPVNDGIRKQTVEFMRHFGLLQSHTSIGSSAQHPFPFRWHSASSTSDIQSHSNLLKAGATADRLSRALHCKTNGGRRNQMYRNDLCTWLDILSPHHAWPPHRDIAPRSARWTTYSREKTILYILRNHHLDPRQIPFVLLRIVNILSNNL